MVTSMLGTEAVALFPSRTMAQQIAGAGPPQTPLFHIHLAGERDVLWEKALDLAQAHGSGSSTRSSPPWCRRSAAPS